MYCAHNVCLWKGGSRKQFPNDVTCEPHLFYFTLLIPFADKDTNDCIMELYGYLNDGKKCLVIGEGCFPKPKEGEEGEKSCGECGVAEGCPEGTIEIVPSGGGETVKEEA